MSMDATDSVLGGGSVTSAAMAGTPAPDLSTGARAHFIGGEDTPVSRRLRSIEPAVIENFEALQGAAWEATDPVTLEMCRLRLADLMDDEQGVAHRTPAAVAAGLDEAKVAALPDWWRSPLFAERERAHLAFAEQFNTSVAHVTDADVEALLEHLTERQVGDFVGALYAVEFEARIRMVAGRVLAGEAV